MAERQRGREELEFGVRVGEWNWSCFIVVYLAQRRRGAELVGVVVFSPTFHIRVSQQQSRRGLFCKITLYWELFGITCFKMLVVEKKPVKPPKRTGFQMICADSRANVETRVIVTGSFSYSYKKRFL